MKECELDYAPLLTTKKFFITGIEWKCFIATSSVSAVQVHVTTHFLMWGGNLHLAVSDLMTQALIPALLVLFSQTICLFLDGWV